MNRTAHLAPFPSLLMLGLVALSTSLAGCHTIGQPLTTSPGGEFPLWVKSNASEEVHVEVMVIEGFGETEVSQDNFTLVPGAEEGIDPVRLPYGEYTLSASSGSLQREVNVIYAEETQFFRFVVHDDVIAFQRHG